ncbi:hypothetical protein AMAG_04438 [Allomyces macrogynus ATCC 38327]|uniref:Nicotinamide-nucleotide adenylyltransferase n=1 Tax=Allomyces macrogynus (strain ATCC 38327) TaxID=578462 RepID=A0A0L0S8Z4_ALLM3|nr:hypothetical protein AMAG_04438 [Allomyces macrogynus ATCC 38327]|eukprot:KNE58901.1 hypothetical protein AMAG_04438 [Allomyces macrogynus ATCC 38327]
MNVWFRSCPAWPLPCRASSAAGAAALRAASATALTPPAPPRPADAVVDHADCQSDQADRAPRKPVRVTILDSSHNPPNAAHMALLRTALQPTLARRTGDNYQDAVDAVLILLAVQNADKGRLADLDLAHRLAMMREVAIDTHEWLATNASATTTPLPSIAVATTDHALFKDKAADILSLLPPSAHLRWVLGEDTLLRIFDPKYYPTTSVAATMTAFFEATRSTFLWARRPALPVAANVDRDALELCRARWFVEDLVLDPDVALAIRDVSSTSVRDAVASGDWDAVERGTVPGVARYICEHGLYGAER